MGLSTYHKIIFVQARIWVWRRRFQCLILNITPIFIYSIGDLEENGIDRRMENILLGEHLKTQLQFYVYKPEVNCEKIPSNYVRHQNVMIRKKKRNKEIKEGSLEIEDVSLI